jgi:peptidoglycan-associated lipoprotein
VTLLLIHRMLLNLGMAILLAAGMCAAQDSNSSTPATTVNRTAGASTSYDQSSSRAPVDPQTAVPDARNGQDASGRPVQTGVMQVPPPVAPTDKQEFSQSVKDIYFDFDRSELRSQDQATLQQDAEWLKAHPNVPFTIAGQADPRGDIVYNLYLSDQRALATRDALIKMGVPAEQVLFSAGWGKLYPVCQQDDESCWSQNRRAHLAPWSADALPTNLAAASGVE